MVGGRFRILYALACGVLFLCTCPFGACAEAPVVLQEVDQTLNEAPIVVDMQQPSMYRVVFLDGFGEMFFAREMVVGANVSPIDAVPPGPLGHTFTGWKGMDGQPYAFGQPLHEHTTLWPIFTSEQAPVVMQEPAMLQEVPFSDQMIAPPVVLPYAEEAMVDDVVAISDLAQDILTAPQTYGARVDVSIANALPLRYGEEVTLVGSLIGYGDVPVNLQWQAEIGGHWQDIPGAHALRHSYILTDENADLNLRLQVKVQP